jgi:hypothetical protein
VTISPSDARRTFQVAEPIHAMIYFTPHFPSAYAAVGLRGRRMGYFASRAAAMGAVPADVVIATFFNFNPAVVRRAIPDAWELSSPAAILAARLRAVDASLREAWGDGIGAADVAEAAELARVAAQAATQWPQGRPLFAAHAALTWPEEPHLVLWHAQTLLREFRGDGHVALLTTAGLSPVEALITHAATGQVGEAVLRDSRGWSEQEWNEGRQRARADGWLQDGDALALSPAGQTLRQGIEDRTDELSVAPYEALGETGCARLRELARPLSAAVIESGLYRTVALPRT